VWRPAFLRHCANPMAFKIGTPEIVNPSPYSYRGLKATTILGVKRGNTVALAGDGQVTLGDVVLKHQARKIRTLHNGQILAGFAGAVADALTLFGKFEIQLKAWDGDLRRASVELAKEWRTDRYLRRLEAQLIVADPNSLLVLSGEGDVIEPDDGIVAIGSGAPYATAAAKALVAHTDLDPRAIVESAMTIAANLCIFTNDHFTIETVSGDEQDSNEQIPPEQMDIATKSASSTPRDEDDEDDEDEESDAMRPEADLLENDNEREGGE
jgi:ATP-dependent HslUV protease, peptidase subunit HslV